MIFGAVSGCGGSMWKTGTLAPGKGGRGEVLIGGYEWFIISIQFSLPGSYRARERERERSPIELSR